MAWELVGAAGIWVGLLFCCWLIGARRPFSCAVGSMAMGVGSLLAVNAAGYWTGIVLPLSLLHLGVSLAGGPAGVALLVILQQWIV